MKYNYGLTLIILLCLFSSCGIINSEQPVDETIKSYNKSVEAETACRSIRLTADLAFDGPFLYNFFVCLSQNKDGKDIFPGIHKIIRTLGVTGVDDLTKLLLFKPVTSRNSAIFEYPLIRNLLLIVERGVFGELNDEAGDAVKIKERFGDLQDLFLSLRPKTFLRVLTKINEQGALDNILNRATPLLLGNVPLFLSGQINAVLTKNQLQKDLWTVSNDFFKINSPFPQLKEMFTFEELSPLSTKYRGPCLTQWAFSSPFNNNNLCQAITSESDKYSFYHRYKTYVEKLSDEEDYWAMANALTPVTKLFFAQKDQSVRTLELWNDVGIQIFSTQKDFLAQLTGFMAFYWGDSEAKIPQKKIKDLEEMITALEEILAQSGPVSLLSANLKVGSAKLHQEAEQLLINGGVVASCNELKLTGLIVDSGPEQWSKRLLPFLLPNSACPQSLSPLASFTLERMSNNIGLNFPCDQTDSDACISVEQVEYLAKDLKNISYSISNKLGNSYSRVLRSDQLLNFLNEALDGLITLQKKNSQSIYQLNLGPVNFPVSKLLQLKQILSSKPGLNIEQLVDLEEKGFTPSLTFFEKLSSWYLRVSAQEYAGYQYLFNSYPQQDGKAKYLLQGYNSFGPLENMAMELWDWEKFSTEVKQALPANEISRMKEYLSRISTAGGLFQDQRLDPFEDTVGWSSIGSEKRAVEFIYKKVGNEFHFSGSDLNKSPYLLSEAFSEDHLRLKKLISEDVLSAKDASPDLSGSSSDQILHWMHRTLYPYLQERFKGEELWDSHPSELFQSTSQIESEKYSLLEKRALFLFISQNFLIAPDFLPIKPETYQIEKIINKKRPDIRPVFLALPSGSNEVWTRFLSYLPKTFERDDLTVEQMASSLFTQLDQDLWSKIPWSKLPFDKNGKRDLPELEENQKDLLHALSFAQLFAINPQGKITPFAGIASECEKNPSTKISCPIKFLNSVDSSGKAISAIESLKDYASLRTIAFICPFIIEDGPFSKKFAERIRHELAFDHFTKQTQDFCQDLWNNKNFVTKNAQGELRKGPPFTILEDTLKRILSIGKNPQIIAEVANLSNAIEQFKIQKKLDQKTDHIHQFLNSYQVLSEDMDLYSSKQIADHKGFLISSPSLINNYLYYLGAVLSQQGQQYNYALWRYGNNLKFNEDLNQGSFQKFLVDVLIKKYREEKDVEAPLSHYVFNLLTELNKDEHRQALEALLASLAYPSDIETLPTFTKTLPLLLNHIYYKSQQNELWIIPGANIIRPLISQGNFRSLAITTTPFSLDEVVHFGQSLVQGLNSFATTERFEKNTSNLSALLMDQLTSIKQNGDFFNANWQSLLLNVLKSDFLTSHKTLIKNIFSELTAVQTKLSGTLAPHIDGVLVDTNLVLVKNGVELAYQYQTVTKEMESETLKKIILGFLNIFSHADSLKRTTILKQVLSDSRLSDWNMLYGPILTNKEFRQMLLSIMKKLNVLNENDLKLAVDELPVLNNSAHNLLHLTTDRLRWRENTSQDVRFGLHSLHRLSKKENIMMSKQRDCLSAWLQDGDFLTEY